MYKRYWIRGALLAAVVITPVAIVVAAVGKPPAIPQHDFSRATAYKVVSITDGDTLVVSVKGKQEKVRLIGVDTPEKVAPRKSVQYFSLEASRFLHNLLANERVFLKFDREKKDSRGRTLAYVFRAPDGMFVNLEIVRQGYGRVYKKFPFRHRELFGYYGEQARMAKRGLWNPGPPTFKPIAPSSPNAVFVMRTSEKYHRASCRYVQRARIALTLNAAKKLGYKPCTVCAPTR